MCLCHLFLFFVCNLCYWCSYSSIKLVIVLFQTRHLLCFEFHVRVRTNHLRVNCCCCKFKKVILKWKGQPNPSQYLRMIRQTQILMTTQASNMAARLSFLNRQRILCRKVFSLSFSFTFFSLCCILISIDGKIVNFDVILFGGEAVILNIYNNFIQGWF